MGKYINLVFLVGNNQILCTNPRLLTLGEALTQELEVEQGELSEELERSNHWTVIKTGTLNPYNSPVNRMKPS